ncbi:MAG: hypothetical protein P0Y65_17915 [Candidatus Devosia phytovorans]|uniref:Uncharacterized protein n=1 Tax=Candidatus Devosia phytovorans TaxID=3121372 RepID=A0AAJ5VV97_9HYPH|nr:hypothetical protein [Devosia sp.]WEK04039.1 MAG: hypothetical protein P0Y65_17915 [Devosia sp.]
MKPWLAAIAFTLVSATGAHAFQPSVDAAIGKYKSGKLVDFRDVGTLMREAAKWCYAYEDQTCAWTDVYFDVDEEGAVFEINNAWDAERNVGFTDIAVFEGNRICQSGYDWVPTVWAERRDDDSVISGRDLHDLKQEIYANRVVPLNEADDCFDYLYLGADTDSETITLLQRQYVDGVHEPTSDVEVSLYFNAEDAASLSLRW